LPVEVRAGRAVWLAGFDHGSSMSELATSAFADSTLVIACCNTESKASKPAAATVVVESLA
jgi:hypothetical protein